MTAIELVERVERDTARWQAEGLGPRAALCQAYTVAVLDLEASGELPVGYLRYRGHDTADEAQGAVNEGAVNIVLG